MRLRALLALLPALAGLVLVGPAGAAHAATDPVYPPQTCPTLSVSTTHPAVGETITVTGRQFDADQRVTLELHPRRYVLGTVRTDSSGAFSTRVTMPAGVTGNHVITARGAQSACPADPIQITIQGSTSNGGTPSGGGTPAMTGVDILGLLAAAAALIGAGVLLNRRSRRTRRRHSPAV